MIRPSIPWYCDLCGGEGGASLRDVRYLFSDGMFYHTDPRVCKEILEEKAKKNAAAVQAEAV